MASINRPVTNKKEFTYKKSLCAFLDILGFEGLVNKNDQITRDKLGLYFWLVDDQKKYFKSIDPKSEIKILGISDSIIMSYELSGNSIEDMDKTRHFLLAIAKIQSTFAKNNIWLRGGVSIGEVCCEPNESFIVGPGYIRAYNLEKVAKYPRVIVDVNLVEELELNTAQDLIEKMNMNWRSGDQRFDTWQADILYDWYGNPQMNARLKQDVPIFIDYLSTSIETEEESMLIINLLKENLLSGIAHFEKYQWVANYLMNKADVKNFPSSSRRVIKDHYEKIFSEIKKLGIRA